MTARRARRALPPAVVPALPLPHAQWTAATDVVVVGSGAAGATLALELARRGRDVLVLERGPHVDPDTFGEDEAEQLGRLYAEGALTLTNDFRLQVLQGTCVGGSTVVNNGVCLDPPDDVLERWLDPGQLDAGLDADRLRRAVADARRLLRTRRLGPPDDVLNPGGEVVADALRGSLDGFEVVEANMRPCLGCGHCNLGCRFDRKLSALDWILPEAQAQHRDAVRILPDCRVERILTRGPRATGVEARLGDGRRLEVRAEKVVLSAGAIASSLVLQRSGLGGGRAGRGLAFNLVSPVTLDFDRVLHSERGAQISHVLESRDERGERVLLETWFNPVVTQSLAMPGWFDEHWDNMRRYRHMTCLGVVIGSEGRAEVRRGLLGPDVRYRPTDREIVRLKQGVRLACEVGLRAGARRAMPATIRSLTVREPRELARIETEIGGLDDLLVSTSHPQGGNPVSRDAQRGVVDPGFRVHGTENAYVCDASVFPSAITVNPQLTVVALAVYAADEIAGPARPPRRGARAAGAAGTATQAAPSTVQAAPAGGAT